MDSPALLANENVPAPLVRLLQSRGLTVHAVADIMPMASDRARGRSQWPQPMAEFAQSVAQLLADDAAQLLGHLVVVGGRGVRRRPLPQPM